MPLIIFSFAFNPETQEASMAGNVNSETGLEILQKLAIAEAIQRDRNQAKGADKKAASKAKEK